MGFFSDLKEDLSQAVNELLPDSEQKRAEAEPGEEDEISLDEMLENIDDLGLLDKFEENFKQPEVPAEESSWEQKNAPAEQEKALTEESSWEQGKTPAEQEKALTEESSWEQGKTPAEQEKALTEESSWEQKNAPAEQEMALTEESSWEQGKTSAEQEKALAEESSWEQKNAPAEQEKALTETSSEEARKMEFPRDQPEDIPEELSGSAVGNMQEESADFMDAFGLSEVQKIEEEEQVEKRQPETEEETQSEESKGAWRKMDNEIERVASDETSVITEGVTITGDIVSEGSIDVIGTINGNIDALGKLNITGHVNGNSKAAEIYAESAKINGEVASDGAVKIGASSVIIGNISATSAAIAGAVKGDIDVKGPVILDASAIVMGNIKSKSVQINNGAVIEGMCSQCYADVSPSAFFDDYKPETLRKAKS